MRLKNKVAIVTGGAKGIGAAIVKHFVSEGALTLIADIDSAKGLELQSDLGDMTQFYKLDVSSEEETIKFSV